MERATWINPVWNQATRTSKARSDLWASTSLFPQRGPSPELLDVLYLVQYFFCHLGLPLPSPPFSCFTFLLLLFVPIYHPPFSFSQSWTFFLPLLFLSDILASCSSRQGVCSCRCKSRVAAPEVGHVPCSTDLFPNTSVSFSSQHPSWPERDTDSITTCFLSSHPHAYHICAG